MDFSSNLFIFFFLFFLPLALLGDYSESKPTAVPVVTAEEAENLNEEATVYVAKTAKWGGNLQTRE